MKKKYGKYDNYEIEDAARTLREAEKIKADADKMKYVSECLKCDSDAASKAYKSIADMRKEYANLKDDEDE